VGATLHEFFGATESGMTCHSCRFDGTPFARCLLGDYTRLVTER
jgi:hypothetical protein